MEEKYLPELMAEKDSLDPSFTHALRLVNQEIEKFQKGEGKDEEKYIDVVINKNMKLGQKVLIPVKQFPKFNFVGKLLGPRGNSLKRLQEETLTKMSILGKGSMRDKAKEEELRKSGEAKYFHLNDDLHVLIEVFAPPAEAYARMGHALEEIKKFLIPDYNDEIRQAQLQELTYLNGGSENADVPVVRGKPTLRTRGVPTPAITRTMMMDMALLMMNRVMIPMITAIAPQPKAVLITMIMDMDSVKKRMIPMGKRSGLTRDTRPPRRGPRRASTGTSHTADTDCAVCCCDIASLHQSCILFKECQPPWKVKGRRPSVQRTQTHWLSVCCAADSGDAVMMDAAACWGDGQGRC
ncbi:KH domain-containing, RNA-binding, signal transduction-associated protein 3 isoform X1 [Bos mutus]|uniref:KH domain-containing, RNA-binding, signal transduction-associated protein 3 isoform X1 n=1 Tax=Bos mutus TaxID=72004 RepID=UPI0038B4215A